MPCSPAAHREELHADEISSFRKQPRPTMSLDEIGGTIPLIPNPEAGASHLPRVGSAFGTYPVLCVGCRHFRPAGSTILSAEPACGAPGTAPGTAAGSDFQSYFQSRRLLLRARNSASCEFRLENISPA
jgi:hypothetical protein